MSTSVRCAALATAALIGAACQYVIPRIFSRGTRGLSKQPTEEQPHEHEQQPPEEPEYTTPTVLNGYESEIIDHSTRIAALEEKYSCLENKLDSACRRADLEKLQDFFLDKLCNPNGSSGSSSPPNYAHEAPYLSNKPAATATHSELAGELVKPKPSRSYTKTHGGGSSSSAPNPTYPFQESAQQHSASYWGTEGKRGSSSTAPPRNASRLFNDYGTGSRRN